MVDILPETQAVIGHGAFSVVYKACLKAVSDFLFYIDVVSCCFYFRFQIFSFQTNNYDDKKFKRKTLPAKLQLIWFKKKSFIPFNGSTFRNRRFLPMTHKIRFSKKNYTIEIHIIIIYEMTLQKFIHFYIS